MNRFVLDLLFGSGHQVSHSYLSVLSPVSLHVSEFQVQQFAVEASEEGQQKIFFTLQPEVVVGKVECPGVGARLGKVEEILGTGHESQYC
jgi:hypothetical protein